MVTQKQSARCYLLFAGKCTDRLAGPLCKQDSDGGITFEPRTEEYFALFAQNVRIDDKPRTFAGRPRL